MLLRREHLVFISACASVTNQSQYSFLSALYLKSEPFLNNVTLEEILQICPILQKLIFCQIAILLSLQFKILVIV